MALRKHIADQPGCATRRKLILTALGGAAALAIGSRGATAQPKMSKERAEYQDEPKGGIMMCGTCTLFIASAECKVVEGFVAITGWCNAFDLAD